MKLSLVKRTCRYFVNPLLDRCPPLKTFLKRMFYVVMFIVWRLEVKIRDFGKQLSVDKVCWVDPMSLYFLEKLRRAENRNFKIISESILESPGIRKLDFHVVLALNIFHHFLKKKTTYIKLINLLQNLRMKEMFFQPHLPDEPQMEDAYKNYADREFVGFILKNSCLNEAKLIGVAEGGRPIWRLY